MGRTITLSTGAPKLNRAVSLVENSLKRFVDEEPLELFLNVGDYAKLEKTIKVLFDKASVQKIKQARKEAVKLI